MKSIISQIGQEFPRVKIGVGAKPHPEYDLADWVLSRFTPDERKAMEARYDDVADALEMMMKGQFELRRADTMDKKQRYDVFLLVFGGMFAAGCAWVGLCPSAWVLALGPVLGALGAAASWCVLARFALCRREAWLEKSFTRPLKLLLCPLLWLLYTLAVLGLARPRPRARRTWRRRWRCWRAWRGSWRCPWCWRAAARRRW